MPIKANFKFDNSGFGDKGPVKEDHWWERVFNEASSNMNVNKSDRGEIGIDLNDKDGVEITNKSYSMKKLMKSNAKLKYGNFLKAATLVGNKGGEQEIEGHVSTNDIEIKPFEVLSDEALLKACEFRTAHKGNISQFRDIPTNYNFYYYRCTSWTEFEWKITKNRRTGKSFIRETEDAKQK